MTNKIEIWFAKAQMTDPVGFDRLLSSLEPIEHLIQVGEAGSSFLYKYDRETRTGRFVASDGALIMCFSVTSITAAEARSIAAECVRIEVWTLNAFRDAANVALDASFARPNLH